MPPGLISERVVDGCGMADLGIFSRGKAMMLRGARQARPGLARIVLTLCLLPLSGCGALSGGFLGGAAGRIANLEHHEFLIVSVILVLVWLPVFILVPLIAWHYRISNERAAYRPQWGFSWILEGLIWIPPTLVVVALSVLLVRYTTRLDPYKPVASTVPALQVQVVALDWKWLFLYPAQHIATVNQLVVPAGTPVEFQLTSGTVMQSLLMPRLAGQIFAMAGMRAKLNFEIDKPGSYFGENTQYNGDGFHADKFTIQAMTAPDFSSWVAQAQTSGTSMDAAAYQNLSRQSLVDHPLVFGQLAPDLFKDILAQKIQPGYLAQHHEAGAHG